MIGGLSMTEVIIILGLALLLLGPDQLPSLAKSLGKGLRELRKATDDIKSQFESEIAHIDLNEPAKPPIAPVSPVAGTRENDPAAARAAARRAASASVAAQLSLVSPEGTVPRPQEGAASAPQQDAGAAQAPESAAPDAPQEAPRESAAPEAPASPQEQKA
jgi:sec-independent protein translocase protein TatB